MPPLQCGVGQHHRSKRHCVSHEHIETQTGSWTKGKKNYYKDNLKCEQYL